MRPVWIIAIIVILLIASPASAGEMLIIESFHSTDRWDNGYIKALNKILGRRHKISFFEMNAKRVPISAHTERAEAAWDKYLELKPDYVVLGDDIAIDLLGKRFAEEKIPVVFLGANKDPRNHFKGRIFPSNFTGVLERPLIKKSVNEISKLLPRARKVLVLFDSSEISRFAVDQKQYGMQWFGRVTADIKITESFEEWQDGINNAESLGYDAIIIGHYHEIKNGDGEVIAADEAIRWANRNTQVPLFTFWESGVGRGKTVGGLLVDSYEQGRAAARLLVQVAEGITPNSVMCWKGKLAFSKSELLRWNIRLPGSMMQKAELLE